MKVKKSVWNNFDQCLSCYHSIFQVKSIKNKLNITYENLDEYISLLDIEELKNGLNILNVCKIRGDNLTWILPTLLITEEIIRIKACKYNNFTYELDYSHILGHKIIRVTNLIIDSFKKNSKNNNKLNMVLAAEMINFPEFLVETRHACTHKNIPSFENLLHSIKYLFLWIKFNLWDRQITVILKNQELFDLLKNYNRNKNSEVIKVQNNIHLELPQIFELTNDFATRFITSQDNQKSDEIQINPNKEYIEFFNFLQKSNPFLVLLILFKKINDMVKSEIVKILKFEKSNILKSISDFSKFITNFRIKTQPTDKSRFQKTLRKIYLNLKFCSNFDEYVNDIYHDFNLSFEAFNFNRNYVQESINVENDTIQRKLEENRLEFQLPGDLLLTQINEIKKKMENDTDINIDTHHKNTDGVNDKSIQNCEEPITPLIDEYFDQVINNHICLN